MAKKGNNRNSWIDNTKDVDFTATCSKNLKKNGKFRGSKREKKALENGCFHHAINKKGERKPKFHEEGNKNCKCDMCKDRFRADFYDRSEVQRNVEQMVPMISQAKFLAESQGAGSETKRELVVLMTATRRFPKMYENLKVVVQKSEKNKKKKKKNKNNLELGEWKIKKH